MNVEHKKKEIIELWVRQYADTLYSWALYKTKSNEVAEDLTQDTFFSAMKSYDQCKNKDNPKSWLFSTLNNKIIDHYRKAAKYTNHDMSTHEQQSILLFENQYDEDGRWKPKQQSPTNSEEQHLLDNPAFNSTLSKCLDNLPLNWKTTLISKYIFEKSGSDICQELDISASNYWQIVHRAKVLMRICLEKNWNG